MSSHRRVPTWGLVSVLCLLCSAVFLSCSDEDKPTEPDPPEGACCFQGGSCQVLLVDECEDLNGFWQGRGTVCDPNPCPEVFVGACCIPGGACQVLSEDACEAMNGAWRGPGTVCEPNPCPDPPSGMVWIPAGRLRLGQEGVWGSEPAHEVHVPGFWIGRHEVTNAEYKAFVDDGGYDRSAFWNPVGWEWRIAGDVRHPAGWNSDDYHGGGVAGNANFPVNGVSWWEADAYCRWIGGRLPTEAEWEKAAKGGCEMWGNPAQCDEASSPSYPWGEAMSGQRANYWDSGDPFDNNTTLVGFYNGSIRDGFQTINSPSPYGLYDVAGNVYEWTSTRHADYPYDPIDGREDPPGAFNECCRVLRGGSWDDDQAYLLCAGREHDNPHNRSSRVGFRVAGDW